MPIILRNKPKEDSKAKQSKDDSVNTNNSLLLTALNNSNDSAERHDKFMSRKVATTKNNSRDGISMELRQPYSVKNSLVPGANFTTSKRPEMLLTCSPGPKYLTSQPLTHNRKIITTLKQRYKKFLNLFDKGILDVPGPGKYEIA